MPLHAAQRAEGECESTLGTVDVFVAEHHLRASKQYSNYMYSIITSKVGRNETQPIDVCPLGPWPLVLR